MGKGRVRSDLLQVLDGLLYLVDLVHIVLRIQWAGRKNKRE